MPRPLSHTASPASACRRRLARSVELAWKAFDRASSQPCRVIPSAPILFFGDIDAYWMSPLRVLTVGLNPSRREFPDGDPFRRFPLGDNHEDREPDRYLDAMSAYFATDPYKSWFNAFEQLLKGTGSSYYPGAAASTALHTDICSPVATDPTWSCLNKIDREDLQTDGRPLWHTLLEELRPQIVVISVAEAHLTCIKFTPITDWECIHAFKKKTDGEPRKRPYQVLARWYEVGDDPSFFVFGQAANTPVGTLHRDQKHEVGEVARRRYHDGQ